MLANIHQFVYGSFKHLGHRFISTPNIHDIISVQSLEDLKKLNGHNIVHHHLKDGRVVAITKTVTHKDELDRDVTWNSTILMPIADYFELHKHNDITLFQSYFIPPEPKTSDVKLNPIKVDEP